MIDEILKSHSFKSSFNIEFEKQKYVSLGGQLPKLFNDINEIDKDYVINLLRLKEHGKKEEFLSILFWGIYFRVLARNPNHIKALIKFINEEGFEDFMEKAILEIVNSNSPQMLFKKFSNEYKIPGIGYAYFTKLFFFYREALAPNKQTYPILDKWLSNSWCAIDGFTNKNTKVYEVFYMGKNKNFDGKLKRQIPLAYAKYIEFMEKLSLLKNINIIQLEEKLFGVDLKSSRKNKNYNPRDEYIKWAKSHGLKLSKNGSQEKKVNTKK